MARVRGEAELYALPPENYYLPPIEFTDGAILIAAGDFDPDRLLGPTRRRDHPERALARGRGEAFRKGGATLNGMP